MGLLRDASAVTGALVATCAAARQTLMLCTNVAQVSAEWYHTGRLGSLVIEFVDPAATMVSLFCMRRYMARFTLFLDAWGMQSESLE